MRNCLNCDYAWYSEDYREGFCMAYYTYIHIPVESTECPAYEPRREEES